VSPMASCVLWLAPRGIPRGTSSRASCSESWRSR
jgi:hypothetical protein